MRSRGSPQNILTTMMTRIVVDKSIDNVKENTFSEPEMKKALRDTSTRAALSGLLSTTANKPVRLC